MAHWADRIFCLVRTGAGGKPQAGISFLLIDMAAPGIAVRPIVTLEGRHHLNEVVFDNVRVPVADRVGEENAGWTSRNSCSATSGFWSRRSASRNAFCAAFGAASPPWMRGGAGLMEDGDSAPVLPNSTPSRGARVDRAEDHPRGRLGAPSPAAVGMLKIRGSELEQALTDSPTRRSVRLGSLTSRLSVSGATTAAIFTPMARSRGCSGRVRLPSTAARTKCSARSSRKH